MSRHKRDPEKYTCSAIDDAITELENLRTSNSELRDWGQAEAERVDELEE